MRKILASQLRAVANWLAPEPRGFAVYLDGRAIAESVARYTHSAQGRR